MALVADVYTNVLKQFPNTAIKLAFAYGSGVFQQFGTRDKSKNMLDFIFAVDNATQWHTENLQINPSHYSFLKRFGSARLATIQSNFGAKIYFNTLVPYDGRLLKYGIINTNDLLNDLLDWETLYVSGRLHKPVKFLVQPDCDLLRSALTTNLRSAMHTALLLLDDSFNENQLFTTVTNISYAGDFRMKVGEDQNKIRNIVTANMGHFRNLYGPFLEQEEHLHWNKLSGTFDQAFSPASQYHHLNLLPTALQEALVNHRNRADGRFRDAEDILRSFSLGYEIQEVLEDILRDIVRKSSISQSIKGVLTAGITKSYRYSSEKVKKRFNSKKQIEVKTS